MPFPPTEDDLTRWQTRPYVSKRERRLLEQQDRRFRRRMQGVGKRAMTRLRSRFASMVSGETRGTTWRKLFGYGTDELMVHLQTRFQPGMSWVNYGISWHVDHKECWALDNLQPLWARENLSKGAKYASA